MVRIDVWLNLACIYKTRSRASEALKAGHVKVRGRSARPSTTVKPGDRITVTQPGVRRELEILEIPKRSVSKEEARNLYHEVSREEMEKPEFAKALRRARKEAKRAGRDKFKSRPTKRERRRWERDRER
jgi:ribosome-associated heat shock protein Hsp15